MDVMAAGRPVACSQCTPWVPASRHEKWAGSVASQSSSTGRASSQAPRSCCTRGARKRVSGCSPCARSPCSARAASGRAGPLSQTPLTGRSWASCRFSWCQVIWISLSSWRKRRSSGPSGISASTCCSPAVSSGVHCSCQLPAPGSGVTSQRVASSSVTACPRSASSGDMASTSRRASGSSTSACGRVSTSMASVVSRKVTGCISQQGASWLADASAAAGGLPACPCSRAVSCICRPAATPADCAPASAWTAAMAPSGSCSGASAGCWRSQRSWAQSVPGDRVSVCICSVPRASAARTPGRASCSSPPASQGAGSRAPGRSRVGRSDGFRDEVVFTAAILRYGACRNVCVMRPIFQAPAVANCRSLPLSLPGPLRQFRGTLVPRPGVQYAVICRQWLCR